MAQLVAPTPARKCTPYPSLGYNLFISLPLTREDVDKTPFELDLSVSDFITSALSLSCSFNHQEINQLFRMFLISAPSAVTAIPIYVNLIEKAGPNRGGLRFNFTAPEGSVKKGNMFIMQEEAAVKEERWARLSPLLEKKSKASISSSPRSDLINQALKDQASKIDQLLAFIYAKEHKEPVPFHSFPNSAEQLLVVHSISHLLCSQTTRNLMADESLDTPSTFMFDDEEEKKEESVDVEMEETQTPSKKRPRKSSAVAPKTPVKKSRLY
jgi:hypothetical protein